MEQQADWRESKAIILLRGLLPYLICIALAYGLKLLMPVGRGTLSLGPIVITSFYTKVFGGIGIAIIMAVSLNIVNGYTGQFSLGHAGFMAVGAYVSSWITYYGSLYRFDSAAMKAEFWSEGSLLFLGALLAGGAMAAVFGYLVGLPSLRLRGDYLAIVTLGFGEIVRVFLQQSSPVLGDMDEVKEASWKELLTGVGGALGFDGVPKYSSIFWIWVFALITVVVAYRLKESIHGRAFISIRENEIAAEAMGVPTTKYKVRAFVLAAFFAGIGGGLFAHDLGNVINPREMNFVKSIDFVIMVVLGGMGSISGAVLAATGLTILPEALREFAAYRMIVYALLLIIVMVLRPQGLFGIREIWELPPLNRLVRRARGKGGAP